MPKSKFIESLRGQLAEAEKERDRVEKELNAAEELMNKKDEEFHAIAGLIHSYRIALGLESKEDFEE